MMDTLNRRVATEALSSAHRIATLASVLSSNGYLKMDPGVTLVPIAEAAYVLARFNRPTETAEIVLALRQYGRAYDLCHELAEETERLFVELNGPLPAVEEAEGGVSEEHAAGAHDGDSETVAAAAAAAAAVAASSGNHEPGHSENRPNSGDEFSASPSRPGPDGGTDTNLTHDDADDAAMLSHQQEFE